MPAYFYL